ncbi:MAG: hypothetical protein KC877_04725 [Candidatus Kaiserbacteria bacterium]|nr:hypothetical protein [Candidatus Kaiserbacteria bacterium]MCB9816593.1 hypothetical protein [Candidatus Nomurabacteria bacterium]
MAQQRLNDKAAALHMLQLLRERIGQFPDRMTPKIPFAEIMQTERQVEVMLKLAYAAGASRDELGIAVGEVERLVKKAHILRARFWLRQFRREGLGCGELAALLELLAVVVDHVGLRAGEYDRLKQQQLSCAA